jgi:F0F1-type ATP synthase assembly protein I
MAERADDEDRVGGGEPGGMNQGMQTLSYLIAGVLLYGGLGWVGDHYLGTRFLLPLGIVVGAGFGIYLVVKRFGAEARGADGARRAHEGTTDTTSRTGEGTT